MVELVTALELALGPRLCAKFATKNTMDPAKVWRCASMVSRIFGSMTWAMLKCIPAMPLSLVRI